MTTDLFHTLVAWVAAHPGWMGLLVFLTALGESLAFVGLLVPGAALLFGFGALIGLDHLPFWPVYGWAVAGAIAGDTLSFWLGRRYHQHLRQRWPFSRHPDMLRRGEEFFRRHGGKSILFGRFFGPVRAVVPAVAGMLDMPLRTFLVVNVLSALLWAPAYLLPGMAFAASLELAAQVTGRLVVLVLLLVALLWFTVWLVRHLFHWLQPQVQDRLKRFAHWSRGRPLLGPIGASLLDPEQGELRGLTTLGSLLLGSVILISLMLGAAGQQLPTALDLTLYRFLQDLRTPWADNLMVYITELGDTPVKLAVTAVVFAWLHWQRAHSAAYHWLAALAFGMLTSHLFKWLFQTPRPVAELYPGVSSYAFPSGHAALTTILFGFLAVLIARETTPARRWLPYLGAALVVVPVAFSRLYLGAHWLTDTLGGISLGVVWVSLLGLAYNHHPAPPVDRRGLLLVSLTALLVAHLWYAAGNHATELQRYQPLPTVRSLAAVDWWQHDWRQLPVQRLDLWGDHRQPLDVQWAASEPALRQRLTATGWQVAPAVSWTGALQWLNPQVSLAELPVLPRLHDGRPEQLTLVQADATPDQRWVLRFWDAGVRLQPGAVPLWLGSLSRERLRRHPPLFATTAETPTQQSPTALLTTALSGLRQQSVATEPAILLVADPALLGSVPVTASLVVQPAPAANRP